MGKNPAEKAKAAESKAADSKKVESSRKTKVAKKKKAVVAKPVARTELHCKVAKCKRAYRAKGYCGVHYKQWRQGKFGRARYKICGDVGCLKPMAVNRHGYCEEHYQNYFVKGMEVQHAPAAEAPAAPAKEKAAEKATA